MRFLISYKMFSYNNMSATTYKNIDIEKVNLSKPEKNHKGVYESKIVYDNEEVKLLIQTPNLTVESDKCISFKMVDRGVFFNLLEEFDEKIIELIYKNSKIFFNGKSFSENKIRESYEKTVEIDKQGKVIMNNVEFNTNMKIFDAFKEEVSLPSFPFETKTILHLDSVKFVRNKIIPCVKVCHLKLCIVKKKINECILEDELEPEVVKEPEPEFLSDNSDNEDYFFQE